jgi:hypothetical protein
MSELPKKSEDKVNVFGVVMIGFVTSILLWVSVVALQAYYNNTAGALESDRSASGKGREMRDLKAKQLAEMMDSKFVDPKKGVVTIPIDEAMRLVVRDAKQGARSLVPAVGPHDTPTVPAVSGRPPDVMPAPEGGATAPGGAAPPEGAAAPAPEGGGATTTPAGPAPTTPTSSPTVIEDNSASTPASGSAPTPAPPSPSPNP